MIKIQEVVSKNINQLITKDKFVDKPLKQYLYASLSQPPIKILDKRNSLDELDYIVECPNCHSAVCYGPDIFMVGGHIYCSNDSCREVGRSLKPKKNNQNVCLKNETQISVCKNICLFLVS